MKKNQISFGSFGGTLPMIVAILHGYLKHYILSSWPWQYTNGATF